MTNGQCWILEFLLENKSVAESVNMNRSDLPCGHTNDDAAWLDFIGSEKPV